ncbi:MAG TPA: hypothetical protein VMU29_12155 [Smithella sp.]|nr:hypothetical protein [Smithella sp.]
MEQEQPLQELVNAVNNLVTGCKIETKIPQELEGPLLKVIIAFHRFSTQEKMYSYPEFTRRDGIWKRWRAQFTEAEWKEFQQERERSAQTDEGTNAESKEYLKYPYTIDEALPNPNFKP